MLARAASPPDSRPCHAEPLIRQKQLDPLEHRYELTQFDVQQSSRATSG